MTDDLENELKKIMKSDARGLRFNDEKIRYDLIPPLAHRECAKVWTKGLDKYPENNWEKGMPWSEVIASALRHLEAIRLGEDIDIESGLLHAAHLQCKRADANRILFYKTRI